MTKGRLIRPLVTVVALAAGVTLVWLQHQSIIRLKRDKQALEQQISQPTQIPPDAQPLSNLVAQATEAQSVSRERENELLRLRGEVGQLRWQAQDLEKVSQENRRLQAALTAKESSPGATNVASPDYWPKNSWAFVGFASPENSLQSGLWAANSGDLKTFLSSVTGDMQATVAQDLDGKSDADAKAKMLDEVASITSYRILNREVLSDDQVVLTVAVEEGDQPAATAKLTMQKVANQWKFAAKRD